MIKALIFLGLICLVLGKDKLLAIDDRRGIKFWRDRGGTSTRDVTIFEPFRPGGDYFILGQRAQANYGDMERPVHAFSDLSKKKDLLARPEGFRFIWDDRGSTFYDDASVWRPVCPRSFDHLGDVFANANRVSTPPMVLFDKFRCVDDDITSDCDIVSKIWDDSGNFGSYDVSLWQVQARKDQFETAFFYAKDSHNVRPDVKARCLKSKAVEQK